MMRGRVYLSIGEEAIVENLIDTYGITEIEAIDHVIGQKRELALIHSMRGNQALAEQILSELGETPSKNNR